MNIALWIVQVLLAIVFCMVGFSKIMMPISELSSQMGWVEDFSELQVRGIGVLEALGGIGILLPMILKKLRAFVPLAGVGLALTMIGAIITHLGRGENEMIIPNIVLLALSVFVVIGRKDLLSKST